MPRGSSAPVVGRIGSPSGVRPCSSRSAPTPDLGWPRTRTFLRRAPQHGIGPRRPLRRLLGAYLSRNDKPATVVWCALRVAELPLAHSPDRRVGNLGGQARCGELSSGASIVTHVIDAQGKWAVAALCAFR